MESYQLCRSCMRELGVWENEAIDDRLLEMFFICTNIKAADDIDEILPKQFCNDCVGKLEACYTYITEAQKVNEALRNIILRNKTSVIIEPANYDCIGQQSIILTEDDILNGQIVIETIQHDQNYEIDDFEQCKTMDEIGQTFSSLEDFETITLAQLESETQSLSENDETLKKNVCPVCKKCFVSKTWFTKHIEKEHSGHQYICSYCLKTFSKKSQLKTHLTSHSEERKFSCSTCGKCFKLNKQLAVHSRAHSEARPYACDKCSMKFKKRSVLKCHMKIHAKEKPYLCSYCGWSFSQAGNLSVHLRRHTGDKPYACTLCPFRSAVASNLARHTRTHEGVEQKHFCSVCGKGFCDSSSLSRHTRTHTGQRPYPCSWCPRSFSDSWKRKVHLMRAHASALADIPRMTRQPEGLT